MATHSSTLAWRIPWTEEPGGLCSPQGCRATHDWVNRHRHTSQGLTACVYTFNLLDSQMAISICSESGKKKSESHSVLSNSLQPHGILPARILEWSLQWMSIILCIHVLCFVGTNLSTSKSATVNECVGIYLKTYVSDSHLSMMIYFGSPVVKSLPWNAQDVGSIPGREVKILHASGQLSPWATTTEPMSHYWREACTPQGKVRMLQLRPNTTKVSDCWIINKYLFYLSEL